MPGSGIRSWPTAYCVETALGSGTDGKQKNDVILSGRILRAQRQIQLTLQNDVS